MVERLIDLPINHQPVSTTARVLDDVTGGPFVEVVYELRAERILHSDACFGIASMPAAP